MSDDRLAVQRTQITSVGRLRTALMLTDIVGYARRMNENEARAVTELRKHNELVRTQLNAHHGREVKTIGDAFLAEFAVPDDALRCALAIHDVLRGEFTGSDPLRVRIGLHVAEVEAIGPDVIGDGVNILSRIEPHAEPGGICASKEFVDELRNPDVNFAALGPVEMKHIAKAVELFAWPVEAAAASTLEEPMPATKVLRPPRTANSLPVMAAAEAEEKTRLGGPDNATSPERPASSVKTQFTAPLEGTRPERPGIREPAAEEPTRAANAVDLPGRAPLLDSPTRPVGATERPVRAPLLEDETRAGVGPGSEPAPNTRPGARPLSRSTGILAGHTDDPASEQQTVVRRDDPPERAVQPTLDLPEPPDDDSTTGLRPAPQLRTRESTGTESDPNLPRVIMPPPHRPPSALPWVIGAVVIVGGASVVAIGVIMGHATAAATSVQPERTIVQVAQPAPPPQPVAPPPPEPAPVAPVPPVPAPRTTLQQDLATAKQNVNQSKLKSKQKKALLGELGKLEKKWKHARAGKDRKKAEANARGFMQKHKLL